MKASNFKIGTKVNYHTGRYMMNGTVTGIDTVNNRVYVTWPQHGNSSINDKQLVLI